MEGIVNISSENHRNQSPKELYITSNKTKPKKKNPDNPPKKHTKQTRKKNTNK